MLIRLRSHEKKIREIRVIYWVLGLQCMHMKEVLSRRRSI
jgi:hypothetical protein